MRTVDGKRVVSDNGNALIDCAIAPIKDARELERQLRAIPGVIDTGLFLGTAHTVLVAGPDGVRELTRPDAATPAAS